MISIVEHGDKVSSAIADHYDVITSEQCWLGRPGVYLRLPLMINLLGWYGTPSMHKS